MLRISVLTLFQHWREAELTSTDTFSSVLSSKYSQAPVLLKFSPGDNEGPSPPYPPTHFPSTSQKFQGQELQPQAGLRTGNRVKRRQDKCPHNAGSSNSHYFFLKSTATPHSHHPLWKLNSLLLCYKDHSAVICTSTLSTISFKTEIKGCQVGILSNYQQQLAMGIPAGLL